MKNHCFRILGALASLFVCGIAYGATTIFTAVLNGPSESPSNASPGTGIAVVTLNGDFMEVNVTFSGLLAPTTASHIHAATAVPGAGTAGVATTTPYFAGFPIGVTSGSYDNTLDLTLASSYNPAFVTANGGTTATAEAALVAAMFAGESYLNIHTTQFPGGEIRGFLTVPDGAETAALLIMALFAMFGFARYQRAYVS